MFVTKRQLEDLAFDLQALYEDLLDIIDSASNEIELEMENEIENRQKDMEDC